MLRRALVENINNLKIGPRLIIYLFVAGIVGFLVMALFVKTIVYSRLNELEKTQIDHHSAQLTAYIEEQKSSIKTKTFGWSYWDDSYEFIENFNQKFVERNLDPASLLDYGVSSISYMRIEDQKSFSVAYDKDSGKEDTILEAKMEKYLIDIIEHDHFKDENSYETYLRIDNRLYVVGTAKVLKSDKTGKPKGIMAIAKRINDSDLKNTLQYDAKVDFVRQTNGSTTKIYDDYATISVGIFGHDRTPVGRLTTNFQRSLNAVKTDLWTILAFGILALSFATIMFFYGRISALVISPLQSLSQHLVKISETGKLSPFQSNGRDDEIGQVINSFNEMIIRINALQESLTQKSYQIGKAQSEIDVLHNVKNALSPVSTILSRLDDIPNPISANFERAIDELAGNEADFNRRTKLVDFTKANIKAQIESNSNANRLVLKARESINKAIETIESLRARNNYFEDEFCEITSILDRSLEIARENEGAVNIEFAKPPPQLVKGNKIIYSQVFDNIITNSLEAIKKANRHNGQLSVEIMPIEREFERMLQIKINDNGDGFDSGLKARLFERGFSTRTNKTGGLGLHWCANNLNAMGGTIRIDSEGKQMGAEVIIELPLAA